MSQSVFFAPVASRRRKTSPTMWNSSMNQAIQTKKMHIDQNTPKTG